MGFAQYWSLYGFILHALGRYDREQQIGELARHAYPDRLAALSPTARALAASGTLVDLERVASSAPGLRVDPGYWDQGHFYVEIGEELRAHGQSAEARRYFDLARAWAKESDAPPWRRAQIMYADGARSEARAALAPLRRLEPDNVDYTGLTALIDAKVGDVAGAREAAESLAQRRKPYEFGAAAWYRAKIAAVLGDREGAVARLHESFADGHSYDLLLHRDADLLSLRASPAFEELVRGIR